MPKQLGEEFAARIQAADGRLSQVTEAQSALPVRPGGWSRKEELGHLLDSAANNRVRFVKASLDGVYAGPTYEQRGWAALHGYGELPWSRLLDHWRSANELLTRAVERIPDSALEVSCTVEGYHPVSLRALIVDYLDHMEHHIGQIAGGCTNQP